MGGSVTQMETTMKTIRKSYKNKDHGYERDRKRKRNESELKKLVGSLKNRIFRLILNKGGKISQQFFNIFHKTREK